MAQVEGLAIGVPHPLQKRALSLRTAPHFVQIIRDATSTCAVMVSVQS